MINRIRALDDVARRDERMTEDRARGMQRTEPRHRTTIVGKVHVRAAALHHRAVQLHRITADECSRPVIEEADRIIVVPGRGNQLQPPADPVAVRKGGVHRRPDKSCRGRRAVFGESAADLYIIIERIADLIDRLYVGGNLFHAELPHPRKAADVVAVRVRAGQHVDVARRKPLRCKRRDKHAVGKSGAAARVDQNVLRTADQNDPGRRAAEGLTQQVNAVRNGDEAGRAAPPCRKTHHSENYFLLQDLTLATTASACALISS